MKNLIQMEHVECKLCGEDRPDNLFNQQDTLTEDKTIFNVVRCQNCGLVYVNPRPTIACIGSYYPSQFISYQFETFEGPSRSIRERIVSFITKSSAKEQAKVVQNLVRWEEGGFRVMDVGCGKGRFLQAMKQLGCQVSGLDFNEESVAYCRKGLGLDVVHGSPADLDSLDIKYDLVTMWQFLEHEFDPLSAIRAANRRLDKGRFLVVQVPNVESLENWVFKERSFLYDVPRHLYHFSPSTITRFLEISGFRVEKIECPFLAGGWIGSIQSNLFGGMIFGNLKKHIFAFLAISMVISPLEYVLSKTKKGSLITVIARKISDA